jgi:hypothetical protein
MATLLLAVLIVLVGPFMAGLRGHLLAACVLIVSPIVIGLVIHVEEPPQSDQTHLAVGLGVIATGIALVAWIAGWLIRAVRDGGRDARRRGP